LNIFVFNEGFIVYFKEWSRGFHLKTMQFLHCIKFY